MLIPRPELIRRVEAGLRTRPVTALLGPRQCGKTTLARTILGERRGSFFDLEDPRDWTRLENPQLVLERLTGLIVLDEIQRRPELLPILRVLADRRPRRARFLILGSASPDLMRHSSESLAGRITFVDMAGFTLEEVGSDRQDRLWLRGGFPRSFLARSNQESWNWRQDFVRTFLERDLPQLGMAIPAQTLRRFWMMLVHYHGQIWNASEIGASLGIAHTTARRYLDLMTGAYVIRQLPPWFQNVGKRVVKSPKAYLRDSGLLHTLLDLSSRDALESHPKLGASWEGFALEQVLSIAGSQSAYFWATHGGAELDLFITAGGKRLGFEFKFHDAPTMTRSMHIAIQDLDLNHLWIVHPGRESYPVHERANCLALRDLHTIRKLIR